LDAQPSLVTCDRSCLVALEPFWNLSGVDRTLLLARPVTPLPLRPVIAEHATLVNSNTRASGHSLTPVAAGQLIGRVRSLQRARPITYTELVSS
jgi:hypothetical protein